MRKLTINDLDLKGKKVLMRVDFNVPLDENQNVRNDARIVAALPSIKKILESGGAAILMSHLGRPKGEAKEEFRLTPAAKRLSELLGQDVIMAPDSIGPEVEKMAAELKMGEVMLLENLRFHKEEKKNNPEFAKKLAQLGDAYVNDAFGTAHRAHASTEGVTNFFDQAACGYLIQKELKYLAGAIDNPVHPFIAIMGGAKISGKIDVIQNLFDKVDAILVGGGMTYTFFKAMGYEIGASLLEEDKIELAKKLIDEAKAKGVELILPVDHVIAEKFAADAANKIVPANVIEDGWLGVDLGPKTIELFKAKIMTAKTVVWNGPMGVFEFDAFAKGTNAVAATLAEATQEKGVTSIIGGGDSAAAIAKAGLQDKVSHVSTGGGASLELMGGITLPGIAALSEIED
ncbi:phosphoglycerate kinase [bacterium]|nr:phosphoglycerate kinase [bacterium]